VASMGLGLVSEKGGRYEALHWEVVRTAKEVPFPKRLMQLHDALMSAIARLHPGSMAMEKLFFSRNVRTAMSVGQAQGIILLAAAKTGLEVAEYNPMEVKQSVTGSGIADKKAVALMVQRVLGMDEMPRPDDAADALAVAYCQLVSTRGSRAGGIPR